MTNDRSITILRRNKTLKCSKSGVFGEKHKWSYLKFHFKKLIINTYYNLSLLILVMTTRNDRIENQAAQAITWSAFCTLMTPKTKMNLKKIIKIFFKFFHLVENKIPKFILCRVELLGAELAEYNARHG